MDKGAEKRKNSSLKIDLKSTNGLYMTTVNPCNDFLVDFLMASKLKSQKQGIGKFTTYNLAIQSVRKYPLPIICEAQLAALQGFGDFFINQAAKRIQKHYKRGRLPTPQEIMQDDQEHFEALQNNRRKGYRRKKSQMDKNGQQQQDLGEQQQKQDGNDDESDSQEKSPDEQINKNLSLISQSKISKKIQRYKPRKESEPWKILIALYTLDARFKAISKGQINQIFFNWSKDSVKSWEFCRQRLKECGYIEMDKSEADLIKLTEKGQSFVIEQLGPEADRYKKKMTNRPEQDTAKMFKIDNDKGKLRLIQYDSSEPLRIVINQGIEIAEQMKYLIPKLVGQHKFEYENLSLGSFVWKIYGKILDFIVLRYEFLDDRFNKENLIIACNLVRSCEWGHITIIVEGMRRDQNDDLDYDDNEILCIKMRKMKKVLLDCRAAGFRVITMNNLEDTLQYISETTKILQNKLKNVKVNEGLNIIGTILSLNKKINQNKMLARLYSRCVRLLPGINKSAAQVMTLKFGTFKLTEQKMREKFKTMELRKKFLLRLFESHEISEQNIDKILTFLYSDSYQ